MVKRKVFAVALLVIMVSFFAGGCAFVSTSNDSTIDEPDMEINTSKSQVVEDYTEHKDVSLFDTIFVPATQGEIKANAEAFIAEATVNGFDCIEEAGILLIQNRETPECFLRCELVSYNNKSLKVNKLFYNCSISGVERQVTAAGIDVGQIVYYIGTSEFCVGTQVPSLEEVKKYLNAEAAPEETALGDSETMLGLFEHVLVPLAEGNLLNQANEFKKVLAQYGYIYKDGEGLFTVYDPEHPRNYLFGSNSLLQDTDTISTLGFYMETEVGTKKVEVYFFTDVPEYYVCNADFSKVKVESFEQIKKYITQG